MSLFPEEVTLKVGGPKLLDELAVSVGFTSFFHMASERVRENLNAAAEAAHWDQEAAEASLLNRLWVHNHDDV